MPNRKSIASIETATKKGSTHISLDNDKNSTENTKYERVWKDDEK